MKALIEVIFSMPLILLVKLVLLLRRSRSHGDRLTTNDLLMRAKAIRELSRSLPLPGNEIEAATVLSILMYFDNELDKISSLERANFIVGGTVPLFHEESVPPERLS